MFLINSCSYLLLRISNDRLDGCPLCPSSDRDETCRAAASCAHPRTAPDPRGVPGYGRPRLPSCTSLPSDIPRTTDVQPGIFSLPSAIWNHILGILRIGSLQGEAACVSRNTSPLMAPAPGIRDDRRDVLVSSASSLLLSKRMGSTVKGVEMSALPIRKGPLSRSCF